MKFPLFASCVLASSLIAVSASAQTGSPEGQIPKVTESVEATAVAPDAKKQVDEFFRLLTEGRVDTAYEQLVKGTKLAELPKDLAGMKDQTRKAIQAYGDINGYDLTDQKTVGTRLVRLTCLSLNKRFPIRWRFYFYKQSDTWKLIDIRVNDRLGEMFDEPAPLITSPAK